MKKAFSILLLASVVSFVLMGCTPQAEGDTAAPDTGAASTTPSPGTDAATAK